MSKKKTSNGEFVKEVLLIYKTVMKKILKQKQTVFHCQEILWQDE